MKVLMILFNDYSKSGELEKISLVINFCALFFFFLKKGAWRLRSFAWRKKIVYISIVVLLHPKKLKIPFIALNRNFREWDLEYVAWWITVIPEKLAIRRIFLELPNFKPMESIPWLQHWRTDFPLLLFPLIPVVMNILELSSNSVLMYCTPQGYFVECNYPVDHVRLFHQSRVCSLHQSRVCSFHQSPTSQEFFHSIILSCEFHSTHALVFHAPCHLLAPPGADTGIYVLDDVFAVVQRTKRPWHR